MGFVILSFAFSGFLSMRQSFVGDTGKADVNQRLKTIFASIGPDMIQVGEGLTDTAFPLLEIEQRTIPAKLPERPSDTVTSDITIRRTLIPQTLTSCTAITAGSTTQPLLVDENPLNTNSFCKRNDNDPIDGWPDTLKLWNQKRTNDPGTIQAYIYDPSTNKGEFFDYKGEIIEDDKGNPVKPNTTNITAVYKVNLDTNNHRWERDYPVGSVIYLMDQRQYKVDEDNKLRLIVNDTQTFELAENTDKLDVTVTLKKVNKDSTTIEPLCKVITETGGPTSCTPSFPNPKTEYKFNQIKSIEISAKVFTKEDVDSDPNNQRKDLRNEEDKTMSQKYYPRNAIN